VSAQNLNEFTAAIIDLDARITAGTNMVRVVAYTSISQARPAWAGSVVWQGDITSLGMPTNMIARRDWTQDFGPAVPDGARFLDGTSGNYASAVDSASLRTPSTAITLAGWWKPTTGGIADYGVFDKAGNTVSRAASYGIVRDGSADNRNLRFRLGLTTAGNVTVDNPTMSSVLASDTWYFIAATWISGAAPRFRVWSQAGTLVIDNSGSTFTDSIIYGADQFRVGRDDVARDGRFTAAAIGVHNAVLTDPQIQTWRNTGVPPITLSGGFWAFNGSGATEADTAQSNTLTINGTITRVLGPYGGY
jgi:hypothetical protein